MADWRQVQQGMEWKRRLDAKGGADGAARGSDGAAGTRRRREDGDGPGRTEGFRGGDAPAAAAGVSAAAAASREAYERMKARRRKAAV